MQRRTMKIRILSLLTLVAIMIPMFALSIYAVSSPVTTFEFHFNGGSGPFTKFGTKTDIGEENGDYGAVTVTSGQFGAGRVGFHFNNALNYSVTPRVYFTGTGTQYLYYAANAFDDVSSNTIILVGSAVGTVFSVSGRFQP